MKSGFFVIYSKNNPAGAQPEKTGDKLWHVLLYHAICIMAKVHWKH